MPATINELHKLRITKSEASDILVYHYWSIIYDIKYKERFIWNQIIKISSSDLGGFFETKNLLMHEKTLIVDF